MKNSEFGARLTRLREWDWKPLLPVLGVVLLYIAFMPTFPGPEAVLTKLAPHQQAIALSSTPTVFGSIYWFFWSNQDRFE